MVVLLLVCSLTAVCYRVLKVSKEWGHTDTHSRCGARWCRPAVVFQTPTPRIREKRNPCVPVRTLSSHGISAQHLLCKSNIAPIWRDHFRLIRTLVFIVCEGLARRLSSSNACVCLVSFDVGSNLSNVSHDLAPVCGGVFAWRVITFRIIFCVSPQDFHVLFLCS